MLINLPNSDIVYSAVKCSVLYSAACGGQVVSVLGSDLTGAFQSADCIYFLFLHGFPPTVQRHAG